jgi:hypothetical protein
MAQNIYKRMLHEKINILVEQALAENQDKSYLQSFKKLMKKLEKGVEIQDSSANLMAFLVQDFLDYAQIKADKFRINNKPFKIKQAI